jgi:hypothetical protein
LIEQSKPDLNALEATLLKMDRTSIEKFLVYYHIASEWACAKWSGPYINESIGHLSEDSTEDLTDWIVAQGQKAWNYAQTENANWPQLFDLSNYPNSNCCEQIIDWYTSYPNNTQTGWGSIKYTAVKIFEDRFDESFYDIQDELSDIYDPVSSSQ